MSKAWAGGSTTAWRKLRMAVLAQNIIDNQGMCRLRYPDVCTGKATQVHHTLGRAVTGDDPDYLAAVCKACNLRAGDPQDVPDPPHVPSSSW